MAVPIKLSDGWKACLLSGILGAIAVLAFAPYKFYPLAFFCIGGLAFLASNVKPRQAMLIGSSFGMGLYLFGVSWVYVSLSTYGGMPLWMGSIAVLGFATILAIFTGAATFLANYLAGGERGRFYLLLPFSWVVFEWCKSWVLTGFPWMDFGYTQTPTWLFSWAPIGGIYLVSFLVLAASMLLLNLLCARTMRSRLISLGIIVVLSGSSYVLNPILWTQSTGTSLSVGAVQANVPIVEKWLSTTQSRTLAQYQGLSQKLATNRPLDMVVWPETALPLYVSQTDENFWRSISPSGTAVLAGLLDYDGQNSYNAAALSCADARAEPQLYRKRHLVPFGEYQPLKFLFSWVFEYLQLPMSDFAGWQGLQELNCGDEIKVGLSICYEDAFSNEYRDHLGSATMLVNISEDAWFGDSAAPHQRTQLAQMRARELGRPLVRAANSGPSLFIDARGRVEHATEQFQVVSVRRDVQPMQGQTPFIRFGSWIVWLSLLALILAFGRRLTRRSGAE